MSDDDAGSEPGTDAAAAASAVAAVAAHHAKHVQRPSYMDHNTGFIYQTTGEQKAGWLTKQSRWLNQWRRRYFVLKDTHLFFSTSETAAPHGMIELEATESMQKTACSKSEFAILFHMKSGSVTQESQFIVYADSAAERDSWFRELLEAKKGRVRPVRSHDDDDDDADSVEKTTLDGEPRKPPVFPGMHGPADDGPGADGADAPSCDDDSSSSSSNSSDSSSSNVSGANARGGEDIPGGGIGGVTVPSGTSSARFTKNPHYGAPGLGRNGGGGALAQSASSSPTTPTHSDDYLDPIERVSTQGSLAFEGRHLVKQGYLKKRAISGRFGYNWKLRYIYLLSDCIVYCERRLSEKEKGRVPLKANMTIGETAHADHTYCFFLRDTSRQGDDYAIVLEASTDSERVQWMHALQHCLDELERIRQTTKQENLAHLQFRPYDPAAPPVIRPESSSRVQRAGAGPGGARSPGRAHPGRGHGAAKPACQIMQEHQRERLQREEQQRQFKERQEQVAAQRASAKDAENDGDDNGNDMGPPPPPPELQEEVSLSLVPPPPERDSRVSLSQVPPPPDTRASASLSNAPPPPPELGSMVSVSKVPPPPPSSSSDADAADAAAAGTDGEHVEEASLLNLVNAPLPVPLPPEPDENVKIRRIDSLRRDEISHRAEQAQSQELEQEAKEQVQSQSVTDAADAKAGAGTQSETEAEAEGKAATPDTAPTTDSTTSTAGVLVPPPPSAMAPRQVAKPIEHVPIAPLPPGNEHHHVVASLGDSAGSAHPTEVSHASSERDSHRVHSLRTIPRREKESHQEAVLPDESEPAEAEAEPEVTEDAEPEAAETEAESAVRAEAETAVAEPEPDAETTTGTEPGEASEVVNSDEEGICSSGSADAQPVQDREEVETAEEQKAPAAEN